MRIGVDIDGVVSDSYPSWLEELNRHYGRNITVLDNYDMHIIFNVTWDDMNNFFVENVERLLSMPQPVAGAKKGIETLIREGHDIIYITARRPVEEGITLTWLKKYGIPHETVLFTDFKSKVDLVRLWKMAAFVEDHLLNAQEIAKTGVPVFLLETSYNKGDSYSGITRCRDWQEIIAGLRRLAEGLENNK